MPYYSSGSHGRGREEHSENFEQYVKEVMDEIVNTHQHNHPLYQETRIYQNIIDKENKRAAFVLFEQIDTSGELENQYRYSIWFVRGGEEPRQIYEDHAYMKNPALYMDNLGRDPAIGLEEILADGVITRVTPKNGGIACSLSQIQIKIGLDGKISEPEDFLETAKNEVKRKSEKRGFDYVRSAEKLEGENIAAVCWRVSGRGMAYDEIYIVVRDDKSGQIGSVRAWSNEWEKEDHSYDLSKINIRVRDPNIDHPIFEHDIIVESADHKKLIAYHRRNLLIDAKLYLAAKDFDSRFRR